MNKNCHQECYFRTGLTLLRSCISYEEDRDITNKINKFQRICGTVIRTIKYKILKAAQLKLYNMIAVPTLLYGSECWTLRKTDLRQMELPEMKFLRLVKGCIRGDRIRKATNRQELDLSLIHI